MAQFACIGALLYILIVVLYRWHFHPLAQIPGPKLSALTSLHEFYWNALRDGQAVFKRKAWHELYGPVIRINPNEIHITTPSAYNTIYLKASPRYTKDRTFYRMFLSESASIGLIDPHAHRGRRELLTPLFSRQNVIRMESIIWETVNNLCDQLRAYTPTDGNFQGRKFAMSIPFKFVTCDIISTFCYGESFYTVPNWKTKTDAKGITSVIPSGIVQALIITAKSMWLMQRLWMLQKLLVNLPNWIVDLLGLEASLGMRRFIFECEQRIEIASAPSTPPADDSGQQKTLFSQMLEPGKTFDSKYTYSKPGQPLRKIPTKKELLEEAITVMAGGVEEASSAMLFGLYQVCKETPVYHKVKQELRRIWPNMSQDIPLVELERLPYFVGVIKEILRMGVPVPGKLPRIVPPGGIDVDGWHIPENTIVSMSAYMQNFHPDIFHEPHCFNPERWLDSEGNIRRDLDKHLVSFSKGSRMCLGSNLATAEMYITIGALLRRFDIDIVQEDTNMQWVDRVAAQTIGDLVIRLRHADI